MKLLYFGNERLDAQNLATALRATAPNCTVSWTSRVDRASKWIADNRDDVAALVVEAQIDGESWHSLLKSVGGLAPRPAVIAVVPEGTHASSVAGADHCVERNSPQFRDLTMVVTRAVSGARGTEATPQAPVGNGEPPAPREVDFDRPPSLAASPASFGAAGPPSLAASATSSGAAGPPSLAASATSFGAAGLLLELERKLADAKAALTEAEQRHAAAMAAAAAQLAERQFQYRSRDRGDGGPMGSRRRTVASLSD